jgi:hypothetical protein
VGFCNSIEGGQLEAKSRKINVRWRSGIEEPNSYLLAVCAGHNPEDEDVSADGKETTTKATYQLNGSDFPSMGNPDFDSLSGMQIDTNSAEFTLKRAGKPIGKIRRTISNDGQTLTINFLMANANGVQISELTVFDKQ